MPFLQYRGKVTDDLIRALRHLKAPCVPELTLRILKTMSSLKADVDKTLRSCVVYHISGSRCTACYVGQTDQHIYTWFIEYKRPSHLYDKHVQLCSVNPLFYSIVKTLQSTCKACKSIPYLETLEAQRERKPQINTKDEFRRREVTISLWRQDLKIGVCMSWP